MTIEARREYLSAIKERYKNATKREKTLILNEFCQVCRYSRKYAIRLLSGSVNPGNNRPGPKAKYNSQSVYHLLKIWEAMGKICSKKIVRAMGLWLKYYEDPSCHHGIRMELLQMSSSTIDRLTRAYRDPKMRGLGTTQPSLIKSKIPIELLGSRVDQPGFMESDTVAHCGDCIAGSYVHSLTMTDLYSGWTVNRACFSKSSEVILEAIRDCENSLGFKMIGFACDNGTEFLNEALLHYFTKRRQNPIHFVRRRPYRKNDAAHVEQKNWTHVRQLFGYLRIDDPHFVGLMNEIYINYWNPLWNYFTPVMKLESKNRVGAKIKKEYDEPRTPYERLMECSRLTQREKNIISKGRKNLDPFKLREELNKKLKQLFKLIDLSNRLIS